MDKKGIKVTRGELLMSQAAIGNLGQAKLVVQKDSYWLAKTLGKVNTALKRELIATQQWSNRLVDLHGTEVMGEDGVTPTGRRGIQQTDVKAMEAYHKDMEAFNAETVLVDGAAPVKLSALAEVSLSLADQSALQWLIVEE